jgi:membrane protein YdbS with pleckstrin-like domain
MKIIRFKEKGLWTVVNSVLVLLSLAAGYAETAPETLSQKNPDIVACGVVFVMAVIVTVASVNLAENCCLIRPSWSRSPFRWDRDPLQAIFVTTWCTLGLFLGSLFRYTIQCSGFWVSAAFGSIFLGLVVGQLIVFCRYRRDIQPNDL